MKGYNNEIAVEPFVNTALEGKNLGGFAVIAQRVELYPVKVVFGNERIPDGSTVWVIGDATKHPFAKNIFEIKGKKFIMLPESFIKLVENPDLAKDPETAWQILELGMTKGLFTGKKLSDYLYDNGVDYKNMRRIINGKDRAELIAGYAEKFFDALEFEEEAEEAKPEDS